MKILPAIIAATVLFIAGCSDENRAGLPPQVGTSACSIDGQKQFVLDRMRDVYFWYEMLPATVDLAAFPTPEALLEHLISFQPVDNFSFINLAATDAQFFGEGQYEGFGFSSRFEAADDLRLTRVFESSPANAAGFSRGHRILLLNRIHDNRQSGPRNDRSDSTASDYRSAGRHRSGLL